MPRTLPSELISYILNLTFPSSTPERLATLSTYSQLSKSWHQWVSDERQAHPSLVRVRKYLAKIALDENVGKKALTLNIERCEEQGKEEERGPLVGAVMAICKLLEVATVRQITLQITGAMGQNLKCLTLIDVDLSLSHIDLPHLTSLSLSRIHVIRQQISYLLSPSTLPSLRLLACQFVLVTDSTLHFNDFELHSCIETIVPQLDLLCVNWSDLTVDNLHPQFGRMDQFIDKTLVDVTNSYEFVSCHSIRQAEFRHIRWFGRDLEEDLDDLTLLGVEIAQGEERFANLETLILREEWKEAARDRKSDLAGLSRVCGDRKVEIRWEAQPCDGCLTNTWLGRKRKEVTPGSEEMDMS